MKLAPRFAALGFLVALNVHAYSIESDGNGNRLRWPGFPVTYMVNPNLGDVAGTDEIAAVQSAFST